MRQIDGPNLYINNNLQCSHILGKTLPKGVCGQKVVHHPDDARALGVGYPVEYLADLVGMADWRVFNSPISDLDLSFGILISNQKTNWDSNEED